MAHTDVSNDEIRYFIPTHDLSVIPGMSAGVISSNCAWHCALVT